MIGYLKCNGINKHTSHSWYVFVNKLHSAAERYHVVPGAPSWVEEKCLRQDPRPQQTYNVVGYDFVRWQDNRYYNPYNDYRYDYRYHDSRWRYHGKANGTYGYVIPNPNNNNNAPITVGNAGGSQSYGGNTTGGGSNPVASNPVTSTGGGKKNT